MIAIGGGPAGCRGAMLPGWPAGEGDARIGWRSAGQDAGR